MVSKTSPLNSLTADIGADIVFRRFGPQAVLVSEVRPLLIQPVAILFLNLSTYRVDIEGIPLCAEARQLERRPF
jgi:hypothetical protein